MNKLKQKILILFLVLLGNLSAQNKYFEQPGMETATIGYIIVDCDNGNTILSQNAKKCLTPASITKTITTATALELLGSDFRYETNLEYSGTLSADGVLNGNLYIKGSGDPTLGSYRLGDPNFIQHWADIIYAKGIRSISGNIVADASLFDTEGVNPRWIWEDVGNYYAAGVYALSCYDNTCRVTLTSGKIGTTPDLVKVEPNIPNLKIDNYLVVKDVRSDSAYFYGAPLVNKRSLYGAVPINQQQFIIKGDIPNPPMLIASQLYQRLQEKGISIKGEATALFSPTNISRTVLYINYSQPLSAIVKEINFQSNNFYADHLFRRLALIKYQQASWQGAQYVVKSFWKNRGLDADNIFLFDGSGLSPKNAISPQFFVEVLKNMRGSKNYKTFYNSLPIAGESGTVHSFLISTPLSGKAHIKSGSFGQVQCFAGYIYDRYAFVIMANNFTCSRKVLRKEMERILQIVVFNGYTASHNN